MGSRSRRLGGWGILLTSMDKDGTKSGFDLEMLSQWRKSSMFRLAALVVQEHEMV